MSADQLPNEIWDKIVRKSNTQTARALSETSQRFKTIVDEPVIRDLEAQDTARYQNIFRKIVKGTAEKIENNSLPYSNYKIIISTPNIKTGRNTDVPAQITYELVFNKRPRVKNLYEIFQTFEYKTAEDGEITHYIRYYNVRVKDDWVYVYFHEDDNTEED